MKTWEYLVVRRYGEPIGSEKLSEFGDLGWELVTVIPSYGTIRAVARRPTRFYIFKRPKEDMFAQVLTKLDEIAEHTKPRAHFEL